MIPLSSTQRATILVVDDTPDNLTLIGDLLQDRYKVKAATNGQRALGIAHSAPQPDLILLDIMMPVMDGYAVCRALKDDPATRHIPIIFLTAKASPEDEEVGLQLGAGQRRKFHFEISWPWFITSSPKKHSVVDSEGRAVAVAACLGCSQQPNNGFRVPGHRAQQGTRRTSGAGPVLFPVLKGLDGDTNQPGEFALS